MDISFETVSSVGFGHDLELLMSSGGLLLIFI